MNNSVSLLRHVNQSITQSCSRIPHLKAHILARRTRPYTSPSSSPTPSDARSRTSSFSAQHSRRAFSTTKAKKIAESTSVVAEAEAPTTEQDAQSPSTRAQPSRTKTWESMPSSVLDKIPADTMLDQGHPDGVLAALLLEQNGTSLGSQLDEQAFERAFCALNIDHLVSEYNRIYRHLSSSLNEGDLVFRNCRPIEQRANSLQAILDKLMNRRHAAGRTMTLGVYRHLMRFAEAMGDANMAESIFKTSMPNAGVTPDLHCYNSYMAALVWSGTYELAQKHRDRLNPYNIMHRNPHPRQEHLNWRTPFSFLRRDRPDRPPPAVIRLTCLKLFQQLSDQGLRGDEQTFTNLMLAMGQAGDLEGAKSILRSVWNINPDLLDKFDEEEVESPTFYEDDSPLRPTAHLQLAVVHVFANNNLLLTATSLLDYVSRMYNVPVSEYLCSRLFELTFIFTQRLRTTGKLWHESRNWDPGQVQRDTLDNLYQVMVDEPHNIQPTVYMLTQRAKLKQEEGSIQECKDLIVEAQAIFDQHRTYLSELYDHMRDRISQVCQSDGPKNVELSDLFSSDFLQAKHQFIVESIKAERDLQLLIRAVRDLLKTRPLILRALHKESLDVASDWRTFTIRELPMLIAQFPTLLPIRFTYPTVNGTVTIENSSVHLQHAIQNADDHFQARTAHLRHTLDVDDPVEMIQQLLTYPVRYKKRMESFCYVCCQPGHVARDCGWQEWALAGYDIPGMELGGGHEAAGEVESMRTTHSAELDPYRQVLEGYSDDEPDEHQAWEQSEAFLQLKADAGVPVPVRGR